jgi:TetR/AcrR family transcriptional repressor of nem operon
MARPREFDETEVLAAALELFQTKGFDGTTLAELEQATGLGRGSLYGAFGDKRALFHKVLGRYFETAMALQLDAPRAPGAARAAIVAVFRDIARLATRDRDRKGCMLTNCSIELADRDPDLACEAARGLDQFEHAFAGAIQTAQARGEISAARDPARLARFLTVCMEGMLVLARIRPDAAWLDDAAAGVEDALA